MSDKEGRMEKNELTYYDEYPKKENSEQPQDVRVLMSTFISEATVHGLNKLNGQKIRITFWSIIILASFSYLMYTVVNELRQYYSYPIRTQVNVEYHTEMTFPALTICNLCWRNKSKLGDSLNQDAFYGSISEFSHVFGHPNWSDPWYEENGFYNETTEDFHFDQAMDLSKFLLQCWFDNTNQLVCEQDFVPIFTPSGLCYTFNGDGRRKTTFSGSRYNLHLYVDVNSDSYTWGSAVGTGIQILAHEPGTNPDISSLGVRVKPGSSVYAEISKREYTYLERPYKAFAEQYCETDFPTWSSSSEQFSYTRQYCFQLCFARIVEIKCKCHLVSFPGPGPLCSPYQYQSCYLPTLGSVIGNITISESCSCKLPCRFNHYDISLSTAEFPSTFMKEQLIKKSLPRASTMEDNGIFLHVYFKELVSEKIVQVPVYNDIGDVLAKVGGQMGLFLGASVMSILEFGELGIMLIPLMRKGCRKNFVSSTSSSEKIRG